jgi:hypothetical protein
VIWSAGLSIFFTATSVIKVKTPLGCQLLMNVTPDRNTPIGVRRPSSKGRWLSGSYTSYPDFAAQIHGYDNPMAFALAFFHLEDCPEFVVLPYTWGYALFSTIDQTEKEFFPRS